MAQKLALLGGAPVRKRPFTTWPFFGTAERTPLLRVSNSPKWDDIARAFEKLFAQRRELPQEAD
jgi:hypothetical protein